MIFQRGGDIGVLFKYSLSEVLQEDALGSKAEQTGSINSIAEDTSEFEASSVGPYSAWQSLAGVSKDNTDTSVARNSDGRLEVFVVSTDNQLWHRWQTVTWQLHLVSMVITWGHDSRQPRRNNKFRW